MGSQDHSRLVYSTSSGRACPECGSPVGRCRCRPGGSDDPVPARVIAKLRVERAGRGGKTVTVVYDLPRNTAFLKALSQELKRACGAGGTVHDSSIELQGDLRDRVRDHLVARGFGVKG